MKSFVVEHHIQREILRRLSLHKNLRFSTLKPDGMESNIFMYHLHQLLKTGFVDKRDGGYQLGLQGLRYADNIVSSDKFTPARYPKPLSVIMLTNPKGELLMVCRHKQPYIDMYMFLSGKQHFGEDPLPHAKRELYEKTGLKGVDLIRRGVGDFRMRNSDGEVITHVTAHIYSGEYNGPSILSPQSYYSFSWFLPEQVKSLPLMPGTFELYELMNKHTNELFFFSSDFTIE